MPQLYMLTVPGLKVTSDWAVVHDRLLDEFPDVTDVLATTMTATLLIVYEGDAKVDGWLEVIGDGILSRRGSAGSTLRAMSGTHDGEREPIPLARRGRNRPP